MLKILSYVGTFMAGGIITLFLHCCLILAKDADKHLEDKKYEK